MLEMLVQNGYFACGKLFLKSNFIIILINVIINSMFKKKITPDIISRGHIVGYNIPFGVFHANKKCSVHT